MRGTWRANRVGGDEALSGAGREGREGGGGVIASLPATRPGGGAGRHQPLIPAGRKQSGIGKEGISR
jgi:hypothetical protein